MEAHKSTYEWQRQFFITDHIKHKNGFTLYKIISVVFPKRNPEAGTKIVIWKRFSEFKKLHKELKQRHESLHIGEEVPTLVKSNFFGRFSEEVIKNRKKCISDVLNFVARCPALFTSDLFVKFFRDGYNISEYDSQIDEEEDVNSFLSALVLPNMGQVLNPESLQCSDESTVGDSKQKRLKESSRNAAFYNRFKRDLNYERPHFNIHPREEGNARFSVASKFGIPHYWEEAVAHANEAQQQEILGNYEVAFVLYKTAIVCLLSGVQGDNNAEHRRGVKELTSQYLLKAEWIYNTHLVLQTKPSTPKFSRIPWRSRSQMKRYKVISLLTSNLLVHDVIDGAFVVIKGVLKSSYPIDRSEVCVLPKDIPYMIQLHAVHETETTVFFILEHVKYGKLWDHLEHYFNNNYINDNLDTDITCASPPEKERIYSSRNSVASSGSSGNEQSVSRLESSIYTDTMSCESLSSHDENYFDFIEDYARAKSQKLKEIQDFNERRKQVELLIPVKKTTSQLNLKSLDNSHGQYRSQSLTDLAYESDCFQTGLQNSGHNNYNEKNCRLVLGSDEGSEGTEISSSTDMDTQQLLKNAQRLIESINETLSKSENLMEENFTSNENGAEHDRGGIDETGTFRDNSVENKANDEISRKEDTGNLIETFDLDPTLKNENFYSAISPVSESVPSITEEYSVTAVLQRKGVTNELIKKWAAQILISVDLLHQNGIICRDLNPNNILLTDNGSVKLTYFFRYPNVDASFSLYAKERLYVAPEVCNVNSSTTFASDWWSYGAILFELITAQSFYDNHPGELHSHSIINFPDRLENDAKSLLTELLRYDPNERLGVGISGVDDIKSHSYFTGINWEDI